MPVTIAPSIEAMLAIRDRITSGDDYVLSANVEVSELQVDPLEQIDCLRVDVTSEGEEQLNETLATEDRTSHSVRVWIRSPLDAMTNDAIAPLKLFTRQVFQRLNNFDSDDLRVKVWECDFEQKQNPDKSILNALGMFVSNIVLRVEVEAS